MKDYSLQCCCLAGFFQIKSSETCSSICPPLRSSSLIPLPFCFISRPSLNLENWEQHQILLRLNRCEIRKITPATLSLQDMPCLLFEHTGPHRASANCTSQKKKNKKEPRRKKEKKEGSAEVQRTALFICSWICKSAD